MAFYKATAALAMLMLTLITTTTASPLAGRAPVPNIDFDVLVIGGGPSGLSALSGLARVRRKAILLDSGVYRNQATRLIHDVIGRDGTVPAVFRAAAQKDISRYQTATMMNATIQTITSVDNGSYFLAMDTTGRTYKGRKVILGTGVTDLIPDTPGLRENFGKGIYWCPWCDGWEHRDQPFGIIGPIERTVGDVLEVRTLNKDIVLLSNGSYTNNASVSTLDTETPNWRDQLKAYNVEIEDRIIANITRLQDSTVVDPSGSDAEHDLFLVTFTDGGTLQRSAFMVDFGYKQASPLGQSLGVEVKDQKLVVDFINGMRTRVKGVFAVGDANSDESTNVPHAMFSGKRAAVSCHVELAKEDVSALISRRESEQEVLEVMGRDLEDLWDSLA